ncbi:heme NO-binding domain-containing protein [Psychromarinibacter halotolerans]|nr:heme NO-binding domain-containing protein [Psychromarinibacter halotolerans]MDF0594552.1 heme NO-binding domain-containing protein [Psychromarinibacter halotolerans]
MHGMIIRSIQCFLEDTYGRPVWEDIAKGAGLDPEAFEPMMPNRETRTDEVLRAASRRLDKPRDTLLEDLGTYLVAHPAMQVVRRLLRFCGPDFHDFLYSLEELPERARLAVPDLELPVLDLREHDSESYTLTVTHDVPGFGHVMVGMLRAMADDYGALVLLDHIGRDAASEVVSIRLAEPAFSAGRRFDLRLKAG